MITEDTTTLPLPQCCNCGETIPANVRPLRRSKTHGEVDRACSAGDYKCVSSRVWVTRHVAVQFDVETYSGPEALVVKAVEPPITTAEAVDAVQHYLSDFGFTDGPHDRSWARGLPVFKV